jgi:tetratricopeptide (TPR) repeat protein
MHRSFAPLTAAFSLFLLGLTASSPVRAQEPPALTKAQEEEVDKSFSAGNELLEKKKYAEALVEYRKVLAIMPNDPGALWNAGMAAFFSKDYKTAAELYERDKKQEPNHGHLLSKLIQTYEALGDTQARDAARDEIIALRASGKDTTDYTKERSFCRDQFTVGDKLVYAYEMFEFKPRYSQDDAHKFGVRYNFIVMNPDNTSEFRLEVGWNTLEKDGKGGFKPAGYPSAFYFDAYYPKGDFARKTMGLYTKELTYAATKQHLIDIIDGKVKMSGGTLRPRTP